MKIVVIDNGVNLNTLNFSEKLSCYEVFSDGSIIKDNENYNKINELSHGTLCTLIIEKYGIYDEIISIKVLDENGQGNIEDLITALNWCSDKDINIINLSLGSIEKEDFKKLKDVCNRLYDQGKIVIAAKNNNDKFTAPACFNNVIGVRCGGNIIRKIKYLKNSSDGINYEALGSHLLQLKDKAFTKTENSNSFACAYVTAYISKKIKGKKKWKIKY